jgi:hypothetical protein
MNWRDHVNTPTDLCATTVMPNDAPVPAPVTARDGASSTMERINTAFVLAGSFRQLTRLAAARAAADPATVLSLDDSGRTTGRVRGRLSGLPPVAVLPVVRGLAAARLLLGRPGKVERALLNALIAGVGAALPSCPGLDEPAVRGGGTAVVTTIDGVLARLPGGSGM